MTTDDGWSKYEEHVLRELGRVAESVKCLDRKVTDLRVEVGRLTERVTIRATLVGFLAGGLPVLVALLLGILR